MAFISLGCIQLVLSTLIPSYSKVSWYNDNILSIMQCICLILFFKNLKFKSKTVNYISTYTLAIYIIHEHPLLRSYIWNHLFIFNRQFFESGFFYLKVPLICIIIFISCMITEFIRRNIFKMFELLGNLIKTKCS